jgi:aspartate oxidase
MCSTCAACLCFFFPHFCLRSSHNSAVEVVCREGPARVLELVRLGADFTRNNDGTLHLTREGGHTNRRIVHAADLTGKEIERALLASARAHPNVSFFEHHLATELVVDEVSGQLHCFGVDVLDQHYASMCRFLGLATMLATGGAGQVYPSTTNPHVATGDGMAMAYRAGAAMSNMEFVQFHPTALYSPPSGSAEGGAAGAERTFLITEAVRGEGGLLFNMKGECAGFRLIGSSKHPSSNSNREQQKGFLVMCYGSGTAVMCVGQQSLHFLAALHDICCNSASTCMQALASKQ